MSREIELKYRIPENLCASDIFENQIVQKYITGPRQKIEMQSTYFDTAENALARARASIRIRLENGDSVVTLKCTQTSEGALARRGEWEVNAETINVAIPMLSAKGAPQDILNLIEKSTLVTVAQFSFLRETAVMDCDGFSAHLCVDIGYLSNDGIKKAPLHELELELISGDEHSLCAMGILLCKTFSLREEKLSKLSRARNL